MNWLRNTLGRWAVPALVLGLLPGCDTALQTGSTAAGDAVAGAAVDRAELYERIRTADEAMLAEVEGHADLGPMRTLLDEYEGDLDTISYICRHMDDRASYCWTWASHLNPDLRETLCDRMAAEIGAEYEEQCRLGAPRFVY